MKAILVDDEALALDFLEHQVNKVDSIEVIGKFGHLDIEKHVALLEEVDVLFLDIEMPEMNGLELAERILEIDANISIVFVTAFNDYAVQAFELNALDYVLKPIQMDRLKKTLERVELKVNQRIHKPLRKRNVLRVNVSRELSFKLTNDKLDFIQFRTTKSRELFLYLLHHSDKTFRKSELTELLWADFPEEKAYSQLYTAIYHLRKTLHKYKGHFTIKNLGAGYMLSTKDVFIDLVEWEKQIISAPRLTTKTIDDYEETMKLYTGGFLEKYDYLWAEGERFRLEQLWIKVAYEMAGYYDKQDNLEMAEAWYVKICTARPEEEDAHFLLMKLYAKLRIGLFIDHQYHQLTKAMEDLGLQVSPNITQWYKQWKSKK
ncbi:response regulator [Salicibibacter cibarius]|uniref:Response regulator n=1 Tax=Salicibibacter cibarius TaxID=2743000 RepID=A0A7T6Z772_9BACI|nr:response regulator [Salicibibacter cibarius]QQK78097.1 response regulator [Salicibibacter cibarius]